MGEDMFNERNGLKVFLECLVKNGKYKKKRAIALYLYSPSYTYDICFWYKSIA
mgnify:CR=1 FL=1